MAHGKPRMFVWKIPKLKVKFEVELSAADDYFELGYHNNFSKLETKSIQAWHKLTSAANLAVDIGSYVGVYSLVASRVGGAKQTLAVEPNPLAFQRLTDNLHRNCVTERVVAKQVAVGSKPGQVELVWPRNRNVSSSVQIYSPEEFNNLVGWWIKGPVVQLQTIDSLVQPYGKVDVIKIDVEGFEHEVLLGASKTLRKDSPYLIIEILK
jgi:FkbM family methyltransferase